MWFLGRIFGRKSWIFYAMIELREKITFRSGFKSDDPNHRIALLNTLTECDPNSHKHIRIAALKDPDAGVRKAAAESIANSGKNFHHGGFASNQNKNEYSVALLPLTKDKDEAVRLSAIMALGKLSGPNEVALKRLLGLLNSKDHTIRKAAAKSLSYYGGLILNDELYHPINRPVIYKKQNTEDRLKRCLNDEDPLVRLYCVSGLLEIKKHISLSPITIAAARSVLTTICDKDINERVDIYILSEARKEMGLLAVAKDNNEDMRLQVPKKGDKQSAVTKPPPYNPGQREPEEYTKWLVQFAQLSLQKQQGYLALVIGFDDLEVISNLLKKITELHLQSTSVKEGPKFEHRNPVIVCIYNLNIEQNAIVQDARKLKEQGATDLSAVGVSTETARKLIDIFGQKSCPSIFAC